MWDVLINTCSVLWSRCLSSKFVVSSEFCSRLQRTTKTIEKLLYSAFRTTENTYMLTICFRMNIKLIFVKQHLRNVNRRSSLCYFSCIMCIRDSNVGMNLHSYIHISYLCSDLFSTTGAANFYSGPRFPGPDAFMTNLS